MFGSGYGPLTLDALDYECLSVGVVDLAIIMVYDTVSFIGHIRLMIPCLRQYHNLGVLGSVTTPLVYLLLIISCGLTNDDASRVTRVCKVYGISVLVYCDNCTATQTTIKASLSFKLRLNLEEASTHGFPDSLVLCLH